MTVRALLCPSCGAPLPELAWKTRVTCTYCHASSVVDRSMVTASDLLQLEKRAVAGDLTPHHQAQPPLDVVTIGSLTVRLLGFVAAGESSDVYWGETTWPPQLVTVKIARAPFDAELHQREVHQLKGLNEGLATWPGLARRVPRLITHGTTKSRKHAETPGLVLRYASGYVHSFVDVKRALGTTLQARHLIWLWRRVLELLAKTHPLGFFHGAITPQHLLVNARDHGVALVGWATSVGPNTARAYTSAALEAMDPSGELLQRPVNEAVDIALSARSILTLAEGIEVPAPIADLLHSCAAGEAQQAELTEQELLARGKKVYGPPAYEWLFLPGWPR